MLSQVVRVSRLGALRVARQSSPSRTFATSTIRQADAIQELYLKELKAYKAPTVKASDSKGHVQEFAAPKAPASPEEANLASQIKEYESSVVDVEGQSAEAAAEGAHSSADVNWFEEKENFDAPEDAHH